MTLNSDYQHASASDSGRDAIPLSPAVFGMYLFLSTEVMFFAALIASYIVLRLGVSPADWPSPQSLGIDPWLGAANTVVLIVSGVFMWRAVRACRSNQPWAVRRELTIGLLLGITFLGIKSFEYREKHARGLTPRPNAIAIYPRSDTEYLSAVQAELQRLRSISQISPEVANESNSTDDRERIRVLLQGLTGWTARIVGHNSDPALRESALWALGQAIDPRPEQAAAVSSYVQKDIEALSAQREALRSAKSTREGELEKLVARLQESVSSDEGPNDRLAVQQRVDAERLELASVNNELSFIDDRLQVLDWLKLHPEGIRRAFGLPLPVVFAGGRTWMNGYYLLTGLHAVHLLAGVLAVLVLLPMSLGPARETLLGNVARYWAFVDVVWLVIFPLIYLW